MDSKWSHLWSTAITWRADGVGGKENGACGLTNEYPGGFSLIGAEEWKYDGANDIQAFFYVRQFPLPLSEWTLKEDEAEHRKQIGSPWLWLYVWANWNQSTKESHSLFGTCNRFFMEVSIHGCVRDDSTYQEAGINFSHHTLTIIGPEKEGSRYSTFVSIFPLHMISPTS